jgi:hypothetical protein
MEFNIGKNATLPILKMQVVDNGKTGFQEFNNLIENSAIYFSMKNTQNGMYKILNAPTSFVEKINENPGAETEYYVYYRFSSADTRTAGIYEGEFMFRNETGTSLLPIREKLIIKINETNIRA